MLTLHTYWQSSASFRVRIALGLKGLDYESHPVHLTRGGGQQFGEAYRSLNPESRVPTLVHDGVVVTQSLAIIEYLDERFPAPPLLPPDVAGRARVRSLALLVASDIQPLQNLATARYLANNLGCDEGEIAAWYREWIGRGLAALETRLAREEGTGRFAHGDRPTLADCCLVPQCRSARRFGVDPAQFPYIAGIESACLELEAFRTASPERQSDRE